MYHLKYMNNNARALFQLTIFFSPEILDVHITIHLVDFLKNVYLQKNNHCRIGSERPCHERERERMSHRKKTDILSFKRADIKSVMKLRNKGEV